MAFDLDGARSEGYTDDEIADYLAGQRKFNIRGARAEGYTSSDILTHLTRTGPPPEDSRDARASRDYAGTADLANRQNQMSAPQTDSRRGATIAAVHKYDEALGERVVDQPAPAPTDTETTFGGELGKGFKGGATFVQSTPRTMALLAQSNMLNSTNQVLQAFDQIEQGTYKRQLKQNTPFGDTSTLGTYDRVYTDNPDQRPQLREQFVRSQANQKQFVSESLEVVKSYMAERKTHGGRVPDLTDVKDVKDFTDWLGYNMGSGAATLAPVMLAAVATGGAGAALAGTAMNTAEEAQNRVEFAEANKKSAPQYLAETSDVTAATGLAKGALDVVGGPVGAALAARAGKTIAAQSLGEVAKRAPGQYARQAGEEFLTEGAQDVASIVGEKVLGENDKTLRENALRVFNAAAAGAAGAPGGTTVNVGIDAARALRGEPVAPVAGTTPPAATPEGAPLAPVAEGPGAELSDAIKQAMAQTAAPTAASAVTAAEAVTLPITPIAQPEAPDAVTASQAATAEEAIALPITEIEPIPAPDVAISPTSSTSDVDLKPTTNEADLRAPKLSTEVSVVQPESAPTAEIAPVSTEVSTVSAEGAPVIDTELSAPPQEQFDGGYGVVAPGIDGARSEGIESERSSAVTGISGQVEPAEPVAGVLTGPAPDSSVERTDGSDTALPAVPRTDEPNAALTPIASEVTKAKEKRAVITMPEGEIKKLHGRMIDIDVQVGDTGTNAKMRIDAAVAVRDVRKRLKSANQLLRCL